MASTEVAERTSSVPDLIRTPALEITAEDIALPRIYLGQFTSKAVQDGLVKMGQVYAATGAEDPDPQILYDPKAKDAKGVLFHVLHLRKGKSISDGGELQLFDFDDPNAPADAWVTYQYTLACPEVDTDVPFKILLTRTGRPAALQINTVIKKTAAAGPAWLNAFRLTTSERENAKGKFAVPRVASVEPEAANVAVAETLWLMISAGVIDHGSTGEQPAI